MGQVLNKDATKWAEVTGSALNVAIAGSDGITNIADVNSDGALVITGSITDLSGGGGGAAGSIITDVITGGWDAQTNSLGMVGSVFQTNVGTGQAGSIITNVITGGWASQDDDLGVAGSVEVQGTVDVDVTANSTGLLVAGEAINANIYDAGSSITVDGTVTATIAGQSINANIWDAGSSVTVDGVDIAGQAINAQIWDAGSSVTVDGTVAIGDIAPDKDSIIVFDGGSSLTVDGTVTATIAGQAINANVVDAGSSLTIDQATASNLNAQVVGELAHDAVDSGNPMKIGGKAIDSDPSQAEGPVSPTEVAENDRVNAWLDRSGRCMTGVESRYELLTEIDQIYDADPTTATSSAYDCWMYRHCTLMFALDSTASPTDFTIQVEVTADGTNWHELTNDALGNLIYDDTACATEIHEAFSFPICAYQIRVKVTAVGSDATNYFDLDDTALFLRN